MPKREDYELLWDRYQKDGVPNKMSIEKFCVNNGFLHHERDGENLTRHPNIA